ncbi:DUF4959 domain-containing protein [Sphingobacterium sp. lm-10]|uniref:DUF5000 domain-containing lipoprotein n=1 Tax=Sphingobacterium sp. lm-10 TaxID=2944904 RepID=UPI002020080B|nr:DUF5000 domain-containing lipoprotein [Sphingobacterium sp. lm-10]MCL7986441.1 DUF4959 domain-containing protein [Sphingobacterium sp. lm-10]
MRHYFNTIKTPLLLCPLLLLLTGCAEDLIPGSFRQGEKPGAITSYTVTSVPGGAVIRYELPNHPDLRYVKAVYSMADGRVRENKASIYNNSILVDGFAKAGDYQVKLVAVGVGDVESDATAIAITALTPTYLQTLEKLREEGNITATFGGIRLLFENATETPLAIHIISRNDQGQWQTARDFYTRLGAGVLNVRGFAAQEREFGIFVTDRWNNTSDTIRANFLPLHEVMMDKSRFREYNLPTDTWQAHTGFRTPSVLWDGNDRVSSTIFHTAPGTGIPQHFSFDMGVAANLSRFLMYSRLNYEYQFNHPKMFELWGSNNPDPDGSWDSWTLVGTYNSVKPSGLPLGESTNDDINYARAGEEFDIEFQEEPYRYWRWRTLDTWGGNSDVSLGEFTFFGTVN